MDREARIPAPHPLRTLRQEMNPGLANPDAEFEAFCTDFARPPGLRRRG